MKQNSKKCAALLAAAVVIGLASGGIIAYRKLNSPQPPNTQKTQNDTANSSKSPAEKLIKLTDSVSVKSAAGDYTAEFFGRGTVLQLADQLEAAGNRFVLT